MTDRTNQTMSSDDLPPIPDGGLGRDFPEWLRERPRWAADVDVEPAIVDVSTIDPRELVMVDDLPAWLQAIAKDNRALHGSLALPDLKEPESPARPDSGESAQQIIEAGALQTSDDPTPTVDGRRGTGETPWARTFIPASEARIDGLAHIGDTGSQATDSGQPFPRYVPPPAIARQSLRSGMFTDPWVIGLIGAAAGVVIATIVFLLIQ